MDQSAACRILCIGESTTADGGDRSYPAQLEEVLNGLGAGMTFSVANEGRWGVRSDVILDSIGAWLAAYRPHIVVAMMGINDGPLVFGRSGPGKDVPRWVRSARLFKAAGHVRAALARRGAERRLRRAVESDPSAEGYLRLAAHYRSEGRPAEAEEAIRAAIRRDPESPVAWESLGRLLHSKREWYAAQSAYEKAIDLAPDQLRYYLNMEHSGVHEPNWKPATAVLQGALLRFKDKPGRYYIFSALATIYGVRGMALEAQEQLERARRAFAEEPLAGEALTAETAENYRRLKRLLDAAGVRLICVQYPMRDLDDLKAAFGGERGVAFVDNRAIFEDAVRREGIGAIFKDLFAGDFGHCTPRGNRLLAENVAATVVRAVGTERATSR